MAKHPAIFLDRDGTIIEDAGYINDLSDVLFFPESFNALSILQKHFLLFIITNQSGISKGFITEDEVKTVNNYIIKVLRDNGIVIYDIFYCPHKSQDNCICKKPNPFFINKAAELYNLKLSDSYILGDHPSDVNCGLNAGVKPIFLLSGHGKYHINEIPQDVKICEDILDAAHFIVKNKKKNK